MKILKEITFQLIQDKELLLDDICKSCYFINKAGECKEPPKFNCMKGGTTFTYWKIKD